MDNTFATPVPASVNRANDVPGVRYSLAELLRFVTVVGVLLGCLPLTGLPAAIVLIGLALALAMRQGAVALVLFLGALFGANALAPQDFPSQLGFTLLLGCAVLGWYRWERHWQDTGLTTPVRRRELPHFAE